MESQKNLRGESQRRSFDMAVSGQRERLVRLARRYGPPEEAEDAAHDGVVQALVGLPGFAERARLTTWLHQVVVNASLMRWRRRATAKKRVVASFDELGADFAPDPQEGPATLLERDERRRELREAVASLPPRYRTVAELTFFAEQSTDEVASSLGISRNAVRTRVSRARSQLARVLAA